MQFCRHHRRRRCWCFCYWCHALQSHSILCARSSSQSRTSLFWYDERIKRRKTLVSKWNNLHHIDKAWVEFHFFVCSVPFHAYTLFFSNFFAFLSFFLTFPFIHTTNFVSLLFGIFQARAFSRQNHNRSF